MRTQPKVVLPLLAAGALWAGPEASAASRDACRAAAAHPRAEVLRRSGEAVVWSRELSTGASGFYGCAYGRGRGRRIADLDGARLRLAGRFLAHVYEGSAIGDETSKIALIDLGSGRHRLVRKIEPNGEGADPEIDNGAQIAAFVVTRRGRMAWLHGPPSNLAAPPGPPEDVVRIADGAPLTERIGGTGTIDRRTFRLTRDRRSVTWVAGGARRVVRLR